MYHAGEVGARRRLQAAQVDRLLGHDAPVGVLAAGAGSLMALMIIGAATTASQGVEPPWLAIADQSAGFAFLVGAGLFGLAMLRARTAPRWAAVLFGVSLPLGLGMDAGHAVLHVVGQELHPHRVER